ncbi:hypothetical protein D9M70_450280 [compost metagenome]
MAALLAAPVMAAVAAALAQPMPCSEVPTPAAHALPVAVDAPAAEALLAARPLAAPAVK